MTRLTIASKKQSLYEKAEEYYNSIRTNIQFSGSDIKSIVLTSVQPNEGKSTTAVNLAISMAKVGFKTLLIDADTRNSVLSGTFRAEGSVVGLTSYLSGNAELAEAICETDIPNLMVIPAGQVPPNPTHLLQNTNFTHMMEMTKQLFDYVIIDELPAKQLIKNNMNLNYVPLYYEGEEKSMDCNYCIGSDWVLRRFLFWI